MVQNIIRSLLVVPLVPSTGMQTSDGPSPGEGGELWWEKNTHFRFFFSRSLVIWGGPGENLFLMPLLQGKNIHRGICWGKKSPFRVFHRPPPPEH